MTIEFFKSQADFRKWLEKHHDTSQELWVGYYKKSSGQRSVTWPESVDEALCFGWIDEPYEEKLRKNQAAWDFFEAQPLFYGKAAIWWVVSAKKEETRLRRLDQLIEDSAQGRRIAQCTRMTTAK